MSALHERDPLVADAIENELRRQRENINLIASENYASRAVLEAQGSVFTNKYAEGYPGRRYYGGCEFVDVVEQLAIDRAGELFGAERANVQPHAGAQANMAAYFASIEPGDTVMGLGLDHGGHLTHGSPVSFSAKLYNFVSYSVDRELETIDYDEVERQAIESRPKLIVTGATAYTRTIDFASFPADSRRCRRETHGGHGPYRRTSGRRRTSLSHRRGPDRYIHHPQNAPRSPGRHDPLRRR